MIKVLQKHKLKRIFKSENSRFELVTGLKFSVMLLLSFLFSFYLIWLVMSLNHIFFEANGFLNMEELRQAYFDKLLETSLKKIHYLLLFFFIVFFAGVYVARILVRPFSIIADYCEKKTNGEEAIYNPDLFSDYKLLTRFSEYFFSQIDLFFKDKSLKNKFEIPSQYQLIHKPQFEKVFFFHFALIVIIIFIITVTMVHVVNIEVYESMIDLSLDTLKKHNAIITSFFNKQRGIMENIQIISGLFTASLYLLLAVNLFSRVGGAIFGFFSTMRSFLKGDFNARVHLLGYNHIRHYGRALNKYLKYIQQEFNK